LFDKENIKLLSDFYREIYSALPAHKTNNAKGLDFSPTNSRESIVAHGRCKKRVIFYKWKNNTRDLNKLLNSLSVLAKADYSIFKKEHPEFEGSIEDILKYTPNSADRLCDVPFSIFYDTDYISNITKQHILDSIPEQPELLYPEARSIKRKFYLHVGPTNSGKSYTSIERLKECKNGTFLSPLRLLALEVFDKLNYCGTPCTMITGEEKIEVPFSRVVASTIEILDTTIRYDVAVVDECQMISDPNRGYCWTKAILGLYADEIHLCMAPEALNIVLALINECGDEYEVVNHTRNTKLIFDSSDYTFDNIEDGDALIAFSKKNVLAIAARLSELGIKASVIYGSLPPESRKEQVRLFNEGETTVVVSTDAIGMGLNLPIRRIIFTEVEKFDGQSYRYLNVSEIKQIAGRAGRFGMYEEGYVLSMGEKDIIKNALKKKVPEIKKAYLGFPESLIDIPGELLTIMFVWNSMVSKPLYHKMPLDTITILYNSLKTHCERVFPTLSKMDAYKMITCSVDLGKEEQFYFWLKCCRAYQKDLSFPKLSGFELTDLEDYYRCLDLYFQFGNKFNKNIDETKLSFEKSQTIKAIDKILLEEKDKFQKRCRKCNRKLPYNYQYGLCQRCYYHF
jgi:ATP-dependent RNA helicase SUPV3L1/SUV3